MADVLLRRAAISSGRRVDLCLAAGRFLLWSAIFAIIYTQAPLYTSNQNTKFLHGLARAGLGQLNRDWTASTIDPLPVFTLLVYLTYRFLHEYAFYAYYALLMGVYVCGLRGIASEIFQINSSKLKELVFLTLLFAVHAGQFSAWSKETFKTDLSWQLQAGVAEQYLLGPVFQPCVFGAFIILSIYLFLRRRPFIAVTLLALAATVHTAYLPAAALLTLSYMLIAFSEERDFKRPLAMGLLALALVLPVVVHGWLYLGPTTQELWRRAQDIIVNFRIPQHSLPERWFDGWAGVKIILIGLALYLVRGTRLFAVMGFSFAVAVVLTGAQVITKSNSLAFLAPWRLSVYLVPLATATIIAWATTAIFRKFDCPISRHTRVVWAVSLVALLLLVVGGVKTQQKQFVDYYAKDASMGMMNFVKANNGPGDIYLIPVENQKFRLYTGAPIFINFKTHPYKDIEVIEWYERLMVAKRFYEADDATRCVMLDDFTARYSVTHVVLKGSQIDTSCGTLRQLYSDGKYGVFRIEPSSARH
jgi:hypothetical protein